MNKPLQFFYVVIASSFVALSGGCASAPTPVSGLDNQKSTPQVPADRGQTVFSEEEIAAIVNDDFWGNGATASVDEAGRLTYHVPTKVVSDGSFNDFERNTVRAPNGRFYYIDPVTGRQLLAVDAWHNPGIYRNSRYTQRYSGPGPGSASPRVSSPRVSSPMRTAPVSRGTSTTRDSRN